MGFFDSIKKAMGGGPKTETVKGPTSTLRDAGIDTSGLNVKIGADGRVTVSGRVDSQAESDRITEVLEDMPNVTGVDNRLQVGAPEPEPAPEPAPVAEPAPQPASAPEPAAEGDAGEGRTYTVQPGDSLWKIASETLGSGAEYMKIFEANRDLLDDPNKIFPGQVLKIPDGD